MLRANKKADAQFAPAFFAKDSFALDHAEEDDNAKDT